jgi:4-amino-4-deoxy-L-arabinose transferase-like glycosyltransferase
LSRAHRVLAALLAVCVVGRGAYVLYLVHAHAIITSSGDAPSYLLPARQLFAHGRFDSGNPPGLSEFLRTPGYPAFIAAIYRVFGQSITAVLLVQVVCSAVTVLLVYLLATRMWSTEVGLVAALLTLLEPLQNATTATILTECLAALLLTLIAYIGFVAFTSDAPRTGLWALLGFVLAYAVLVRPALYYLPLFIVVLIVVRGRTGGAPRVLTTASAFLAPLVVIVGGWELRNHLRVGSWRLSGIEARNLYRYRAAGVVADVSHVKFRKAQLSLGTQFGSLGTQRQGPYYDRMYRSAVHILRAHPAATLDGAIRGLGSEVFGVRSKFFEYLRLRPAPGIAVLIAGALLVGFYALCVSGIVLAARRRDRTLGHVCVLGIALYVFLTSAGPEAFGGRGERFRAPIMPILILYAAFGAHTAYVRLRTRRAATQLLVPVG